MGQFRQAFSNIIPYDDPFFQHIFSITARRAINLYAENNRPRYPVSQFPPPPGIPIQYTIPHVIPEQGIHLNQEGRQQKNQERVQDRNNFQQFHQPEPRPDINNQNPREQQQEQHNNEGQNRRRRRNTSDKEQESEERRKKKKRSKKNRNRSVSQSNSSSSSCKDTDEPFTFQKANKDSGKKLSKEAIEIRATVDEYRRRGIKTAKVAFGRLEDKEANFPESLYSDLLQYNYVDLGKIVAEIHLQTLSHREDQQVFNKFSK